MWVFEQWEFVDLGIYVFVLVFQGGVGGVVFVGGGQDFFVWLYQQVVVDCCQVVGGVVGECYLVRLYGEVVICLGVSFVFVFLDFFVMLVYCFVWVVVEVDLQVFDGFLYWLRVGGEEEVGEVQILWVEIELLVQCFLFIVGVVWYVFGVE